jgi:GNAT superfamily N-acetyltransferase
MKKDIRKRLRWIASAARKFIHYRMTDELVMSIDFRKVKPLESKVQLEEIEPRHRKLLAAFHEEHDVDASQRNRIERYLDHNYNGWLGFVEGELFGYVWWTDDSLNGARRHPHLDVYDIELGPRDVYYVDLYVAPSMRGARRAVDFSTRALFALKERGYKRGWALVSEQKIAAKSIYKRLGFQIIGSQRGRVFFERIGVVNGRVVDARKYMF